ncbi:MAG: S1/P1 nuclease [Hyphomicrobiales bacterium]|nr:S1/P1 nuclease [Hyphomicrobiales bacterium]
MPLGPVPFWIRIRRSWWALVMAPALALGSPNVARAWGDIGHLAVAELAVQGLSERSRTEIERLLPGGLQELVASANWADEIIEEWPESYPWHSVDIPHHATGYDRERDCPQDNCIVERIKLFAAALSDREQPPERRVVALKMLVHLVGDLHVPLHAYQPDQSWEGWEGPWIRMGDSVDVLHFWWDNLLVFEISPDPQEVVEALRPWISPEEMATWTLSGPELWADESFLIARDFIVRHHLTDIARSVAYTEDKPLVLPEHVREEARAIIMRRLAMAGVRLAWLINRALD